MRWIGMGARAQTRLDARGFVHAHAHARARASACVLDIGCRLRKSSCTADRINVARRLTLCFQLAAWHRTRAEARLPQFQVVISRVQQELALLCFRPFEAQKTCSPCYLFTQSQP
eukprot:1003144-Pleurochrysis_carterae.AAC.1